MDFNNHNDQKKRNYSNKSNYNHDSNYSDSNKKNEDNIIPEILYDNYDDDRNETHSNDSNKENIANFIDELDGFSLNNSNNDNVGVNNSNGTNSINGTNSSNSSNSSNNDIGDVNGINNGLNNIITNEIEDEAIHRPVDVRIIVDGPEKSEFLSKAIKNIDFFNDFNIIISSIITTNNVSIAKNAVIGSNIILIAVDPDEEGERLFSKFFQALKTDLNYVEFLKFPKLRDIEITDIKNVENEVKNSIIRAGFASIFDISNTNQVKSEILQLSKNLEDSQSTNEKISLENDMLIDEAKKLRNTNEELNDEIKELQNHIDEVKLDFTDFKSRYSNIHSKNLLEIFLIKELWVEVFNEVLTDEQVDKIVIATNKFRPENVLVGQDYVGAISKEDAVDWLKIVKTALIFVENDNNELQEEMINYYKKKQKSENDYHTNDNGNDNYDSSNNDHNVNSPYNVNVKAHDSYKNHNKDEYGDNQSNSNNKYDQNENEDEDNDYDYDITNQFRNFWD